MPFPGGDPLSAAGMTSTVSYIPCQYSPDLSRCINTTFRLLHQYVCSTLQMAAQMYCETDCVTPGAFSHPLLHYYVLSPSAYSGLQQKHF